LIAERRASAKGLAHVARHSGASSTNAEKRIPKEDGSNE
jgi:hypothetical protein